MAKNQTLYKLLWLHVTLGSILRHVTKVEGSHVTNQGTLLSHDFITMVTKVLSIAY